MMKPIFGAAVVAVLAAASPALAADVTMYDQITGQTFTGGYTDSYELSTSNQGWGQVFSSGQATTLTGISAYVGPFPADGSSTFMMEVLADGGAGTPTVSWGRPHSTAMGLRLGRWSLPKIAISSPPR